ncbi:ABC transporter permease [bacterium]|nr:MAG: ABC transporter permease [bacterium]
MSKFVNTIITVAARDFTKFVKDKRRLVFAFIFPLVFTGILGTSNQANFGAILGYNFLLFTFLGSITNTMFQSTSQGIISLLEDRDNDFAQELFVSPVSRYAIIIGKIVGESSVSFCMMLAQMILIPLLGIPVDISRLLQLLPFLILISLLGGGFGLIIVSLLNTQKSAQQIFPLLMFPQFFLAGVFNVVKDLPPLLFVLSRISPMTYAVDLVRSIYYKGMALETQKLVLFSTELSLSVVVLMTVIFIVLGTALFVRKERNK